MIDINFIKDYLVVVVVGICLCVGYIVKKLDFIPNKYIPLINGILGVIINLWANDFAFNPNILLGGLASGLASTGLYELFEQLIFGKKEEIEHEK